MSSGGVHSSGPYPHQPHPALHGRTDARVDHRIDRRTEVHRSIVIWTGIFLLTVAALFSAVGILNRELYSANAFVRIYLDAVADRDVAAALATPGVDLGTDDTPGTGEAALLSPDALGGLRDLALVSDTEIAPDRHRVVYSYTLVGTSGQPQAGRTAAGSKPPEVQGQTEFDVVRTGTSWLFFAEWAFQRSPTARATVTVTHASDFTAGRTQIDTGDPAAFHSTGDYVVLVPSVTRLSHDSEYLGANPVSLTATTASKSVSAIVDVQPTTRFLGAVQDEVNGFLDECAAQPLLYPPGCPFGLDVNDRIATEPAWSIESYPMLTILAGQDSWVVPNAGGSARVSVDIRSLFDGTVSTLEESIPYSVTFALSITPDGAISFAPRG